MSTYALERRRLANLRARAQRLAAAGRTQALAGLQREVRRLESALRNYGRRVTGVPIPYRRSCSQPRRADRRHRPAGRRRRAAATSAGRDGPGEPEPADAGFWPSIGATQ